MTLTEFLLARIAEDEAVARAAASEGRWLDWVSIEREPSQEGAVSRWDVVSKEQEWGAPAARFVEAYMEFPYGDEKTTTDHIARHDPARVLAECGAKRRIVEDAQETERAYRDRRDPANEGRRYQAMIAVGQLAIVYADHPDYDPAWTP